MAFMSKPWSCATKANPNQDVHGRRACCFRSARRLTSFRSNPEARAMNPTKRASSRTLGSSLSASLDAGVGEGTLVSAGAATGATAFAAGTGCSVGEDASKQPSKGGASTTREPGHIVRGSCLAGIPSAFGGGKPACVDEVSHGTSSASSMPSQPCPKDIVAGHVGGRAWARLSGTRPPRHALDVLRSPSMPHEQAGRPRTRRLTRCAQRSRRHGVANAPALSPSIVRWLPRCSRNRHRRGVLCGRFATAPASNSGAGS